MSRWRLSGGAWRDSSYKVSVYALATQGLATVDRRRGSWSAELTDDGRLYLEHGHYRISEAPPSAEHSVRVVVRLERHRSTIVTADALISISSLTTGRSPSTISSQRCERRTDAR